MLPEHELHDLAESIKTDGLLLPIVLDPDGVLLDGRNRLAACELAGVKPTFTTCADADQTAYIRRCNVRRRHMSAGQRAMVEAMVLSVSGHSLRDHAKLHEISRTRLSLANTVLNSDPALAEKVRDAKLGLDAAHDIVRQRKAEAEAIQAKYDSLRRHAPDLAVQVTEGHLTLDDATTTLGKRQEAVRHDQQHLTSIAEHWDALQHLAHHPDTLHTRQVLDGLTAGARALADHLITLETRAEAAHQPS